MTHMILQWFAGLCVVLAALTIGFVVVFVVVTLAAWRDFWDVLACVVITATVVSGLTYGLWSLGVMVLP